MMIEMGDSADVLRVKIFGIGAAGCKIVGNLIKNGDTCAEYYVVPESFNSELMANINKIEFKTGLSLKSDNDFDYLKTTDNENRVKLMRATEGADFVILIADMDDEIGGMASVLLANVARESGTLIYAVVCAPFSLESKRSIARANIALKALADVVDTYVVISGDKISKVLADDKTVILDLVCAMAQEAVNCVAFPLTAQALINIDFKDVKIALKDKGEAYFGLGLGEGNSRAMDASNSALHCEWANVAFDNHQKVLVNIAAGEDVTTDSVAIIGQSIYKGVDKSSDIILSVQCKPDLMNKTQVTVLATK